MGEPGAGQEHVVVIGAGIAGLLTAAALARDGRTVTVLDRDDLPDAPVPRPGVPQGRQPHLLLHRGLLAIEELLPGFGAELLAAGAVPVDTGELAWLGTGGWAPPSHQPHVLLATRPLIEHVARRRVQALPGVRAVGGQRVTGLRRDGASRWLVDAVTAGWSDASPPPSPGRSDAVPPSSTGGAASPPWPADLVVDASGRASRLPTWLAALGRAEAPVEEVDAHLGYATVRVRLPAEHVVAPGVVVLPQRGRGGGIAVPAEGGRWTVSGTGAGEQRPPRDLPGLRDFLAALRDDSLVRLLAAGEVEGDVATHRQTANRRHRYDRVTGWPDGLLVVGDALCAFDPVYGQGMTVAALEALALRRADGAGRLGRPGVAARAVRTCVRLGELPWQMATSADRVLAGLPTSRAPVSVLAGRWIAEVDRMSTHGDVEAQLALSRLYQLAATPTSLLRPRLVARWLRARVRGLGPPVRRPPVLRDELPVVARGPVGGAR
ncbi:FAD-dependent oxidoreductase [Cellulomonas dongxiuzhuiae]|uniref:FAD-dependent oxidoreductase n=1 Tax=Cellulomonas dongxiuzhuiae TaxID=2819979 RepID=UPI001AAF5378|nr:FAD-dependent oxidoreductase [Cellulomonas dongxiuzhuiae]MBO3089827.1 FAD-dependent oxidoreductase [Cellulomonas dongxiuzhuiae]